jgi:hypothetical protein
MNEKNGAGYNPAVEDVPARFEEDEVVTVTENELVVVDFSENEIQELMVGEELQWTVMLKDGTSIDLLFRQEKESEYE